MAKTITTILLFAWFIFNTALSIDIYEKYQAIEYQIQELEELRNSIIEDCYYEDYLLDVIEGEQE